jgi:hypothetical protein
MTKRKLSLAMALAVSLLAGPVLADEFSFMAGMNVQASANIGGFTADLSVRFGVPQVKVQSIIQVVEKPAEAYLILRTAELAKQPPDRVITEYKANKGKGWGVIAKNLGIKPGSAEFHALKRGEAIGGKGGRGGGAPSGGPAPSSGPPGGGPPGKGRGRGKNK